MAGIFHSHTVLLSTALTWDCSPPKHQAGISRSQPSPLPHHGAAPAPAAQIWHQRNPFRRDLGVRFLVLENRTHKLMETHLQHPHGQQPRDSPVQTHGQEACIKLENGILSSQNQGEKNPIFSKQANAWTLFAAKVLLGHFFFFVC